MGRFTIGIVNRDRNPHTACFEDVARALAATLRELGHEVTDFDDPGRLIMFGAGHLTDEAGAMPKDAIFFNTEQMPAFSDPAYQMRAHSFFKHRVVWDYSQANITHLRGKLGMLRVVHCPVSFHPSMVRFEMKPEEERDVDVLFYGAVSVRRKAIFDKLEADGLRVKRLFGVYGEERDAWIARSKIVLNVHFFAAPIFEIFRVSHLLANGAFVVNEMGGLDPELEAFARVTTSHAPYEQLVDACKALVRTPTLRAELAARASATYRRTNLCRDVATALEQSEVDL